MAFAGKLGGLLVRASGLCGCREIPQRGGTVGRPCQDEDGTKRRTPQPPRCEPVAERRGQETRAERAVGVKGHLLTAASRVRRRVVPRSRLCACHSRWGARRTG